MAKYKIKVNVELVECDESINSEPMKHDNGNFTMTISEQDAISIDKCERKQKNSSKSPASPRPWTSSTSLPSARSLVIPAWSLSAMHQVSRSIIFCEASAIKLMEEVDSMAYVDCQGRLSRKYLTLLHILTASPCRRVSFLCRCTGAAVR